MIPRSPAPGGVPDPARHHRLGGDRRCAVGGALWWRSQQEAAALAEKAGRHAAQRLADAKKRPRVAGVTETEIISA